MTQLIKTERQRNIAALAIAAPISAVLIAATGLLAAYVV